MPPNNGPKPGVPGRDHGSLDQPDPKAVVKKEMDQRDRQAKAAMDFVEREDARLAGSPQYVEPSLQEPRDDVPPPPPRSDRYANTPLGQARRRADEADSQRGYSFDDARGGRGRDYESEWSRNIQPMDPERRALIRRVFEDRSLPRLPQTEDWHRCWVSTTHPTDTPQHRHNLGYRLFTLERARQEGWQADEYAVKDASSTYSGCVAWREMLAMEIPRDDWRDIMVELHHNAPMAEARAIYDNLEMAGEQIRSRGGRTSFSPGFEDLTQYRRAPDKFET